MLRGRDAYAEFDPILLEKIKKLAEDLGSSWVTKDGYIEEYNKVNNDDRSIGRTELGKLIDLSDISYHGTTIQLATSGYHTNQETVSIDSVAKCLKLLSNLLIDTSSSVSYTHLPSPRDQRGSRMPSSA